LLKKNQVFEVSTKSGKRSFCGVHEFIAPEGYVLIPRWMMDNLNIRNDDVVHIRRVQLPKATFLKLQPHTANFLTIPNAKGIKAPHHTREREKEKLRKEDFFFTNLFVKIEIESKTLLI
jgi:hypothetical protein